MSSSRSSTFDGRGEARGGVVVVVARGVVVVVVLGVRPRGGTVTPGRSCGGGVVVVVVPLPDGPVGVVVVPPALVLLPRPS
jgi:hypothetical protein